MRILQKINFATIYFVILGVILTGSLAPFVYIFSPVIGLIFGKKSKAKYTHFLAKTWGTLLTMLVFPILKIDGLENYDPKNAYIITQNHQSAFDIFFTFRFLKGDFCFISKEEYFHFFVIGYAMRTANYIAVKRDSIASLKMIDEAIERIRGGRSVIIYPEGTRSKDGNIKYPKKGFILAAKECPDTPILPVVIDGMMDIMKTKTFKLRLFKKVRVRFLPPIYIKDMGESEEEMLTCWHEMMTKELNRLRNEK